MSDREPQPIDMRERRHGYFPKLFVWRGHPYRVNAVERAWTTREGDEVKQHFRVRCPEGTFDVFQNMRYNSWHLERRVA